LFFILCHLKTREWIWNQLSTNQHTLFSYLISNRVTYLLHIYYCQFWLNKIVITANSRSDHNDAVLSSILEV
jgi:imidazoleglycerol phosphate synthase glutamine amidotransferase subunit HisH